MFKLPLAMTFLQHSLLPCTSTVAVNLHPLPDSLPEDEKPEPPAKRGLWKMFKGLICGQKSVAKNFNSSTAHNTSGNSTNKSCLFLFVSSAEFMMFINGLFYEITQSLMGFWLSISKYNSKLHVLSITITIHYASVEQERWLKKLMDGRGPRIIRLNLFVG